MGAIILQVCSSVGGMPKKALPEARITFDGIPGDWQLNRKHHGGRDRAICLYSKELYDWLAGQGVPLSPGDLGENFSTIGIDLLSFRIGDRLRVGHCTIELASIRVPCSSLNQWHPQLLEIIVGHTGWLARVIEEGS